MTERTSKQPPRSAQPSTAVVTIERIVAGGSGLARHNGRALLVPMTAPGDVVEVEVPVTGPNARLIHMLEAGPDRVVPACRHYGGCGGCDLMHLDYGAQVRAKQGLVADVLRRVGGIEWPDLEIVSNPRPFGSRIRATWHPSDTGAAGYYRRGTHEIVEIDHCPILDPALEAARSSLRISSATNGLTNGEQTSLAANGNLAQELEFAVAGERLRASADVFFQASLSLLDQLVEHVIGEVGLDRPELILELYAGIGLFTVPLGRLAGRIVMVESSATAVEFARRNVTSAGLSNVEIHQGTVERWLVRRTGQFQPEVVLVDPPRVGLSARAIKGVIAAAPRRLVYVSCDPPTFARDARLLSRAGYRMATLEGFDLFPQTHHVELVARFDRSGH